MGNRFSSSLSSQYQNQGLFVLSKEEIQKRSTGLPAPIKIPGLFHSKEIPESLEANISSVALVPSIYSSSFTPIGSPTGNSSLLYKKQLIYISSDEGHLIRLRIVGQESSPDLPLTETQKWSIQFQHVSIPSRPILKVLVLEKVDPQKDILALFGDLCQGEISLVSFPNRLHIINISLKSF